MLTANEQDIDGRPLLGALAATLAALPIWTAVAAAIVLVS
jgi:hypothetical protein